MVTAATPERTVEQRANALRKANEIRVLRAEMKRDLTAERAVLLLAKPPPWLRTMRLEQMLIALPGWGRTRSTRLLVRCHVSPAKTVGGLSIRQRRAVIAELKLRPEGKVY